MPHIDSAPKIYAIEPPRDIKLKSKGLPPVHPNLPQIEGFGGGALVLMLAKVKSGKSTCISNYLLRQEPGWYQAQDRFDRTYIISNTIANDITSRYLKKAFDCYDYYDDSIVDGIVEQQKQYEKEDMPDICLVCDDCLGSIKKSDSSAISRIASRFRHFNIRLMIVSSQNIKSVSPVVRQNATNIWIGKTSNGAELRKISEEYGDNFGGYSKFMKIYEKATENDYDFLHLDFQSNPPKAWCCHHTLLAEGETMHFTHGKQPPQQQQEVVVEDEEE